MLAFVSSTNKSRPTITVIAFAYSSTILPTFGELTATSIYVNWSRVLAIGPVNYRTRDDPVGFDVGNLLVCADRVTDLLQPAFEGALSDGIGHLGHFDRFRYE